MTVITPDMDEEAVGRVWSSLSPEARRDPTIRAHFAAYSQARASHVEAQEREQYRQLRADRQTAAVTRLRASTLPAAGTGTLLADVPILRTGTFRSQTFTRGDLAKMVSNFASLHGAGTFTPPVRTDHSMSVHDVVGTVEALRVDGDVLRADLLLTEPHVVELLRRGTIGHRSAEVGPYVDNAGQTYTPTLWGVAFVDIPAVEGLGPVPLPA